LPLLALLGVSAPAASRTICLHDALPIYAPPGRHPVDPARRTAGQEELLELFGPDVRPVPKAQPLVQGFGDLIELGRLLADGVPRSEEHTSALHSRENLVCRLLLGKKNSN